MARAMVLLWLILGVSVSTVLWADSSEQRGVIRVVVEKLRNDRGQVGYGLFRNGEGFPANFAKAYRTVWAPIEGARSTAEFTDVPYGNYGIGVIHDENNNGQLDNILDAVLSEDKGFSGMEGHGVSNNVKGVLVDSGKYADTVFRLQSPTRSMTITMIYSKF